MGHLDDLKKDLDRNRDRLLSHALIEKQHELNRDLLQEQHKLNKRLAFMSGLFAVVASIVGVLVGVSISNTPSETPTITLQSPVLYSNVTTIYLHNHQITELPKSQVAPVLTNVSSPNPTLNQTTNSGSDSDKVRVNKQ